jgi:hypothetical protein
LTVFRDYGEGEFCDGEVIFAGSIVFLPDNNWWRVAWRQLEGEFLAGWRCVVD